VLTLFTDDGVFEDVTSGVVVRGKEDLRRYLVGAFATILAFTFGVLRRFAAGSWAAIEWTMSGANRRDWAGMPATGRRFASVRGTSILELEAGKIRRQSDYWDAATVMKQVGLPPSRHASRSLFADTIAWATAARASGGCVSNPLAPQREGGTQPSRRPAQPWPPGWRVTPREACDALDLEQA
jgi:steroid delta-isomerase-like uncharacterized protein